MRTTILALALALVLISACSDEDTATGPVTPGINGTWNLFIESESGSEKISYGINAAATNEDGYVTFSFNSTAIEDPATEIWEGPLIDSVAYFKVVFVFKETGERVVSPFLSPRGTFNAEFTSFRTERWERRDEANNSLGYYLYTGYKIRD